MTGIIALYGSGEFTPAMKEIDSSLLSQTNAASVLILPTAAGLEADHRRWITAGMAYYQSLGVEVSGLDLISREQAESAKIAKELEKHTYFVFSGGDPGYLLSVLQGSLAWKTLLRLHRLGATLIGSSAGAMVMGRMVWADIYDFDKKGLVKPWVEGLGLVDFGVLPHYELFGTQYTSESKRIIFDNFPSRHKIIGIEEDTAYINISGSWTKKGRGKVHNPAKL